MALFEIHLSSRGASRRRGDPWILDCFGVPRNDTQESGFLEKP